MNCSFSLSNSGTAIFVQPVMLDYNHDNILSYLIPESCFSFGISSINVELIFSKNIVLSETNLNIQTNSCCLNYSNTNINIYGDDISSTITLSGNTLEYVSVKNMKCQFSSNITSYQFQESIQLHHQLIIIFLVFYYQNQNILSS